MLCTNAMRTLGAFITCTRERTRDATGKLFPRLAGAFIIHRSRFNGFLPLAYASAYTRLSSRGYFRANTTAMSSVRYVYIPR